MAEEHDLGQGLGFRAPEEEILLGYDDGDSEDEVDNIDDDTDDGNDDNDDDDNDNDDDDNDDDEEEADEEEKNNNIQKKKREYLKETIQSFDGERGSILARIADLGAQMSALEAAMKSEVDTLKTLNERQGKSLRQLRTLEEPVGMTIVPAGDETEKDKNTETDLGMIEAQQQQQQPQQHRRCCGLHPWAKRILVVLSVPPMLITVCFWIANTSLYETQWDCIVCRSGQKPSIKQQFLFFTVWNIWFTTVVITAWAATTFTANNNNHRGTIHAVAQKVFLLALPHATTVCLTYIYYVATNPVDGFVDEDLCHRRGRTGMAKTLTDDPVLIDLFLVCAEISDVWIHWVTGPLMILLLVTGEFGYDVWIPYSTIVAVVLGSVIGLAQTYSGSLIYCGGIWFQVGMLMLINFVIHWIYVVLWRYSCRGPLGGVEGTTDDDDNNNGGVGGTKGAALLLPPDRPAAEKEDDDNDNDNGNDDLA